MSQRAQCPSSRPITSPPCSSRPHLTQPPFASFFPVVVMFKATGDAPILKQSKFKVVKPPVTTCAACGAPPLQLRARGFPLKIFLLSPPADYGKRPLLESGALPPRPATTRNSGEHIRLPSRRHQEDELASCRRSFPTERRLTSIASCPQFLYLRSAFTPSFDDRVLDLFEVRLRHIDAPHTRVSRVRWI